MAWWVFVGARLLCRRPKANLRIREKSVNVISGVLPAVQNDVMHVQDLTWYQVSGSSYGPGFFVEDLGQICESEQSL